MLTPASVYLVLGCRVAIGLTFALAAVGKVPRLDDFRESLAELTGMPPTAVRVVAPGVVAAEALVVAAMPAGSRVATWGLGLAVVLLAVFSAVMATALVRGRRVSCACFGTQRSPVSALDLVRNAGLAGCAGLGVWILASGGPLDPPQPSSGVIAAAMAAIAVAVLLHLSEIAMLVRPAPNPGGAR